MKHKAISGRLENSSIFTVTELKDMLESRVVDDAMHRLSNHLRKVMVVPLAASARLDAGIAISENDKESASRSLESRLAIAEILDCCMIMTGSWEWGEINDDHNIIRDLEYVDQRIHVLIGIANSRDDPDTTLSKYLPRCSHCDGEEILPMVLTKVPANANEYKCQNCDGVSTSDDVLALAALYYMSGRKLGTGTTE